MQCAITGQARLHSLVITLRVPNTGGTNAVRTRLLRDQLSNNRLSRHQVWCWIGLLLGVR